MTKIDAITYGPKEIPTIYMDNGVTLHEQAIGHLADTRAAHEETYDASMFIQAAWNAAHPVPETVPVVPARTPMMTRNSKGISYVENGFSFPLKMRDDNDIEFRTLTPLPEPKPEPWETARYCYADGLFLERREDEHGTFWLTVEDNPGTYDRAELAKHNPRPVEIK